MRIAFLCERFFLFFWIAERMTFEKNLLSTRNRPNWTMKRELAELIVHKHAHKFHFTYSKFG